jgi:hypothetical protein
MISNTTITTTLTPLPPHPFVQSEKMSEKMRTFLAENDATMELRNSYGDGAFDEGRITFTVALPVVAVKDLILNLDCDLR